MFGNDRPHFRFENQDNFNSNLGGILPNNNTGGMISPNRIDNDGSLIGGGISMTGSGLGGMPLSYFAG